MVNKILKFFSILPKELYILVISMLPIVELRGAVPVGAVLDIPFYLNLPLSILGNMIPIPLILLFIPKILDLMEKVKFFRPVVRWLRGKAQKHSKRVLSDDAVLEEKAEAVENSAEATSDESTESSESLIQDNTPESENIKEEPKKREMTRSVFVALMLFVAIPIPGTGAWTGALVASLFGLPRRKSCFAIFLGVLICALIMGLASYGVLGFLKFLA